MICTFWERVTEKGRNRSHQGENPVSIQLMSYFSIYDRRIVFHVFDFQAVRMQYCIWNLYVNLSLSEEISRQGKE